MTPDRAAPESPYRSPCRDCRRREDCPYSDLRAAERALRRAAAEGRETARLLKLEARRLQGEIARADSAGCLLRVGAAAEGALSGALRAECGMLERLSAL